MQNFLEYNFESFGGAFSFRFLPHKKINQFPIYIGNQLSVAPSLKTGAQWYTGLAVPRSLQFTEEQQEPAAGKTFLYTFTGVYPQQNAAMHALFEEMSQQKFLVDITDNNKKRRLLGNERYGASFSFGYGSKANTNERPEYNFTFSFTDKKSAPFYNPPV